MSSPIRPGLRLTRYCLRLPSCLHQAPQQCAAWAPERSAASVRGCHAPRGSHLLAVRGLVTACACCDGCGLARYLPACQLYPLAVQAPTHSALVPGHLLCLEAVDASLLAALHRVVTLPLMGRCPQQGWPAGAAPTHGPRALCTHEGLQPVCTTCLTTETVGWS